MPVVEIMVPCPRVGPFMFWPRRWPLVSSVDTGQPRTSLVGSESEWPGECHGNAGVLSERRWSTRMGVRGHGFRGVGTVRYLCRVY